MKATTKASTLDFGGLIVSGAAPIVATATQFPVLIPKSAEATVSGVFILAVTVFGLLFALSTAVYMRRRNKAANRPKPPISLIASWGLVGIIFGIQSILPQAEIIALAWAAGATAAKGMSALGAAIVRRDVKRTEDNRNSAYEAIQAFASASGKGEKQ
ncbi:MAG: hypothetical protein LBT55_01785 [Clostridiaceae bacterium]|nr:hypothetical protein [Clostridiaceae bacterium]